MLLFQALFILWCIALALFQAFLVIVALLSVLLLCYCFIFVNIVAIVKVIVALFWVLLHCKLLYCHGYCCIYYALLLIIVALLLMHCYCLLLHCYCCIVYCCIVIVALLLFIVALLLLHCYCCIVIVAFLLWTCNIVAYCYNIVGPEVLRCLSLPPSLQLSLPLSQSVPLTLCLAVGWP